MLELGRGLQRCTSAPMAAGGPQSIRAKAPRALPLPHPPESGWLWPGVLDPAPRTERVFSQQKDFPLTQKSYCSLYLLLGLEKVMGPQKPADSSVCLHGHMPSVDGVGSTAAALKSCTHSLRAVWGSESIWVKTFF